MDDNVNQEYDIELQLELSDYININDEQSPAATGSLHLIENLLFNTMLAGFNNIINQLSNENNISLLDDENSISLLVDMYVDTMFDNANDNDDNVSEPAGIPENVPIDLPVTIYGNIDLENKTDICPICIDDFENESSVILLTCKHIFHKNCINSWLRIKNSCPMCKISVV